jgi:hypothetical protein
MAVRHLWFYRSLGAYFFALGALGFLGLAAALVTAFRDVSLLDLSLSTIAFLLPLLAGLGLWRRGRRAWPLALATLIPQILDIATGHRLFRFVLGIYWKVALHGAPPESGVGFAVGVSDPTPQPGLGSWISLNLVPLALALTLGLSLRRSDLTPAEPGSPGAG